MIRAIGCTLVLALLVAGCTAETDTPKKAGGTPPAKKPVVATAVKVADESGPIAEALAKAKEAGKNVLIEYYAESCNFCTQMDEEVYPDEFVKDALTNVVYVRLHQGTAEGEAFEAHWGNAGTPSFIVLRPDGTQVGRMLTGFIETMDLVDFLDWSADPAEKMPRIKTGGS